MKKELIVELFEKFEKAGVSVPDHFADVGKMIEIGSGSQKNRPFC